MFHKILRGVFGAAMVFALVFGQETRVLAVTTGSISGIVSDAKTHAPIAGAQVTATSPSGNYRTSSDGKGFYILQGMQPDTYNITASAQGYAAMTLPGETVITANVIRVNIEMATEARVLGHLYTRAQASLVQPSQPTDTYTLTTASLEQVGGTPLNDNEAVLIEYTPSISATVGGGSPSGLQGYYPLIRGGLENNEGFQLEGISGTEPLSNQFINNLILDGARSINVVAGAGDATQGGAGSGYVNVVTKTGTYPATGQIQTEVGFPAFGHAFKFEYGNATPDGRFSYFLSGRYDRNFGGCCAPPYSNTWGVSNSAQPDTVGQLQYVITNDSVGNIFYKWGQGLRNQLQLWQEWGSNGFIGSYGVNPANEPYASNEPFIQFLYGAFAGLPPQQIPFFPGQGSTFQNIGYPQYQYGNFSLTKLQYSRQASDTLYYNFKVYRTQNDVPFGGPDEHIPYLGYGFASSSTLSNIDFWEYQHTQNTGGAVEVQKSLSDRHVVTAGAEYRFSKAYQDVQLPSLTLFFMFGLVPDYLPGGQFAGVRLPAFDFIVKDPEYASNAYIADVYKPNDSLTIQPGIRWERQRVNTAGGTYDATALSPRFNIAYQAHGGTVLRASFGHATIFAPLGQLETIYNPPAVYKNFPATANICGGSASGFSSPCANYFDELYNAWWAGFGTDPYAFPKAQESDTIDFSFEHEFAHNITLKLTPYLRHDYNVITNESVPHFQGGAQLPSTTTVTNAGIGHTYGIEFALAHYTPGDGLNGQLGMTYINQFINYLSSGGFEPTVNPQILNSGTYAHPSYLSPFQSVLSLDYRRHGWRIDPVFVYDIGVPIGIWANPPVLINGKYVPVPSTNLFGSYSGNYCYYADPQVPGTPQNPNIVGSIGGGCTKSLNGGLTHPDMNINLDISRELVNHVTVGLQFQNLLDNVANYPHFTPGFPLNSYVNNGFGAYGPGSGTNPSFGPPPFGLLNAPRTFGPGPWYGIPSGPGFQATFYVNAKY